MILTEFGGEERAVAFRRGRRVSVKTKCPRTEEGGHQYSTEDSTKEGNFLTIRSPMKFITINSLLRGIVHSQSPFLSQSTSTPQQPLSKK